jgi:carbonic anhydrase
MARAMRASRAFFGEEDPSVTPRRHKFHSCPCCHGGTGGRRFDRRRLLHGAGAAAAMSALPPRFARAASGKYEAMILGCIDPRMQEPVRGFAVQHGLIGQYSQFTIAGAAIGVVAPAFAEWHKAFWDNLAASIQLHGIESIIAIDHRDCGAAKIAYGEASIATPEAETATHRAAMTEFRKQVGERQPKLKVETILMALDGSIISFS